MEKITNIYLQGIQERVEKPITAHNFEYQEIGATIQKKLDEKGQKGKAIWPIFHKAYIEWKDSEGIKRRSYITEDKVRRAWEVCERKEIYSVSYLLGVLKRI